MALNTCAIHAGSRVHEWSNGHIRGINSSGSPPDRSRHINTAARVGRIDRDARHDATTQVEHLRGPGGGELSWFASQMVTVNPISSGRMIL